VIATSRDPPLIEFNAGSVLLMGEEPPQLCFGDSGDPNRLYELVSVELFMMVVLYAT